MKNKGNQLVEQTVKEKDDCAGKDTTQINEDLEMADRPLKEIDKYFDMNDSFMFEDVPEDEGILETLISDVDSKKEEILDDETSQNIETGSKVRVESLRKRVLRTYSKRSDVSDEEMNNTNVQHCNVKKDRKGNMCKEKEPNVEKKQATNGVILPGHSTSIFIKKEESGTEINVLDSNFKRERIKVLKEKELTVENNQSHARNSVIEAGRSTNAPENKLNSLRRVYLATLQKSQSKELNLHLINVAKEVSQSGFSPAKINNSSNDKTVNNLEYPTNEKLLHNPEVRNLSHSVNLAQHLPSYQTRNTINSPSKYPSNMSGMENLQLCVSLTDYRKENNTQLKDERGLSSEKGSTTKHSGNMLDLQSSEKSKRVLKQSEIIKKMYNEKTEKYIQKNYMRRDVHQLSDSSVKPVNKGKNSLQKNQVNTSQDLKNDKSLHSHDLSHFSFPRSTNIQNNITETKMYTLKSSKIPENDYSTDSAIEDVVRESKEHKYEKNVSIENEITKNIVNETSTPIKSEEHSPVVSNHKRLSLQDMFKKYSEMTSEPPEPNVFSDKQKFIQSMLANSNKKSAKSSLKFDSLKSTISPNCRKGLNTSKDTNVLEQSKMSDEDSTCLNFISTTTPPKRSRSQSKQSPKNLSPVKSRQKRTIDPVSSLHISHVIDDVSRGLINQDNCNVTCKGRKRSATKRNTRKADSCVITNDCFNISMIKESLIPTVVKDKKIKSYERKSVTIRNLLSTRIQTRSASKKESPVKTKASGKSASANNKILFKKEDDSMHASRHSDDKLNATSKSSQIPVRKRSQSVVRNDYSELNSESKKRRKVSAIVDPKLLLDTRPGYSSRQSRNRKSKEKHIYNKRIKRSACSESDSSMSEPDQRTFTPSKDPSLSKRLQRSASMEPKSFYVKEGQAKKKSVKRHPRSFGSNLNRLGDILVASKIGICTGGDEKIYKQSLSTSEMLSNINEHIRSNSVIDEDTVKLQCVDHLLEDHDGRLENRLHNGGKEDNLNVPTINTNIPNQASTSQAMPINHYVPFTVQTPFQSYIPAFNSINNSTIYGNTVPILNSNVYPYSNQIIVQPQNSYQLQNSYGNIVAPPHNSFIGPQSSIPFPIYQNGKLYQTSNVQYNNAANTYFVLPPGMNAPNPVNICANTSLNTAEMPNFNVVDSSRKGGQEALEINDRNIYEQITIEEPDFIRMTEELREEMRLSPLCSFYIDAINFVRTAPAKISVKEFYSKPKVINCLANVVLRKEIGNCDIESEVDYKFEEGFFESPLLELLKDYTCFHLDEMYKKPQSKLEFIAQAYRKLQFRACHYFCKLFPAEYELDVLDEQDLAVFFVLSAFIRIYDECKVQNLL